MVLIQCVLSSKKKKIFRGWALLSLFPDAAIWPNDEPQLFRAQRASRTAEAPTRTRSSTTTPTSTARSGSPGRSKRPCPSTRPPSRPSPRPGATRASPSRRTRTATRPSSASTAPSWCWTTRPGPGPRFPGSPPLCRPVCVQIERDGSLCRSLFFWGGGEGADISMCLQCCTVHWSDVTMSSDQDRNRLLMFPGCWWRIVNLDTSNEHWTSVLLTMFLWTAMLIPQTKFRCV